MIAAIAKPLSLKRETSLHQRTKMVKDHSAVQMAKKVL